MTREEHLAAIVRASEIEHHEVQAPAVDYGAPLTPLTALRGGEGFWAAAAVAVVVAIVLAVGVFG